MRNWSGAFRAGGTWTRRNWPGAWNNGRAELQEAHWYDYLVINDDQATALAQLQAIVAGGPLPHLPALAPLAPRFLSNNT